jgi:hypothetical protein
MALPLHAGFVFWALHPRETAFQETETSWDLPRVFKGIEPDFLLD